MGDEALRLAEPDTDLAAEFTKEAKQRAVVLSALSIMEDMHAQGLISDKKLACVRGKYKV